MMTFKEVYDEVKRISPPRKYVTVEVTARRFHHGGEELEWEIYIEGDGPNFFKGSTAEECLVAYRAHINLNGPPTPEGFKAAEELPVIVEKGEAK